MKASLQDDLIVIEIDSNTTVSRSVRDSDYDDYPELFEEATESVTGEDDGDPEGDSGSGIE